jgi:hypothetical protein
LLAPNRDAEPGRFFLGVAVGVVPFAVGSHAEIGDGFAVGVG